ncbi:MAG: ATP-binding cassette domain-containing protein [bacterium]|nr:ATP-binding cassette domain-containing protein [bacterium]
MRTWSVAVQEAEWTIAQGEQWVVTGPMASGKTTLALALHREALEESALVTFGGQAASSGSDWAAARYHASIEYDFRTVDEVLSYEQVNDINPFEVRPPERKARVAFKKLRAWCERVFELGPLLDRWTVQLSNGEQRRVMLACAILRQTPLLILDDPFAGLDPQMQQRLREVLAALVEQGRTLVVMVRHEDEIPPCMTHHLKLRQWRIVRKGRYQKPLTEATPMTFKKNPPSLKTPVVIEVKDLTLPIDGRMLFEHFDWDVHQGERWLIVGPNGSGKTTLLSLISGDHPFAYACEIQRFGVKPGPGVPLWSIRSRIATVSPESQVCLDAQQTVESALFSGCFDAEGNRLRPTAAQRKQAMQLVAALGLHEHLHATLGTLSAGVVRLMLVIRALVPQPALLLLDEVCMNLEVAETKKLLRLLKTLFERTPTLTVICIAHRADHIPFGFDRCLQLGR